MKSRVLLVAVFTFAVLSGTLFSVKAQPAGWRAVNEKRENDGYKHTIFWEHPSGRKRTQEIFYFKNYTPLTKQGENEITRDGNGKKLYGYFSNWDLKERQISYSEEHYDSKENVKEGKRWYYKEENGQILEPRINETFNPGSKKWERIQKFVRILHVDSRREDAKRLESLLKENGFKVKLQRVVEEAGEAHRGKIYYRINDTREEADSIAKIVKNVEAVQAMNLSGRDREENPPDFALWISSKKEADTTPDTSENITTIPNPTIEINPPPKNREIFAPDWETTLDYFLHFNQAASKNFYNFNPLTLRCPPNPEKQYPTWKVNGGPIEYHVSSLICASAVHAGKITFASGGEITIRYIEYNNVELSRRPKLAASTQYGVTSNEVSEGAPSRFRFVD